MPAAPTRCCEVLHAASPLPPPSLPHKHTSNSPPFPVQPPAHRPRDLSAAKSRRSLAKAARSFALSARNAVAEREGCAAIQVVVRAALRRRHRCSCDGGRRGGNRESPNRKRSLMLNTYESDAPPAAAAVRDAVDDNGGFYPRRPRAQPKTPAPQTPAPQTPAPQTPAPQTPAPKPLHHKPLHHKPLHHKPLHHKPLHHKPLLRACSLAPQFLCGFLPPSTRSVQMTLANTVNLALTPAQASAPHARPTVIRITGIPFRSW